MSAIRSIPTQYNGIRFRSRFEAEYAQTLDHFCVDWEYEPESFLLETGVHFWPDFRLPLLHMWVELRGYVSEKGEAQIAQFAKELKAGNTLFVVRVDGQREIFKTPTAERTQAERRVYRKELVLFSDAMVYFDNRQGVVKRIVTHKSQESKRPDATGVSVERAP